MKKLGMVILLASLLIGLPMTVLVSAESDGFTSAGIQGGESVGIQTLVHSTYENGAVRLEFDWRDNTGDVLRFRCVNNGSQVLWGGVYEVDPVTQVATELWTGTCQPRQTVTYPVNRFNFAWDVSDSDGDGIPDGGIIMGTKQIRTRYPA